MGGWAAGISGWVVGVLCGAGGLFILHHHGPFAHHGGRHGHHEPEAASPVAAPAAAPELKPAYLVVLGEVYDRENFMAGYTAKLPPLYEKFGGEYLAAGRNFEVLEGTGAFKSYVISKWPSMQAVKAFWTSPEYKDLQRARIDGNWGRFDVYAIEGLSAPRTSAAPAPAGGDAPR